MSFESLEQECRNAFSAKSPTTIYDIQFFQDPFSPVDCLYMSAFTEYVCELKKRPFKSDMRWPNQIEGFIIEKHKYDVLMAHNCPNKIYVNIFDDCLVIWSIKDLNIEWSEQRMQADHRSLKRKNKMVGYLRLNQASHIFAF